MHLVDERIGHPFHDDRCPFNDLDDLAEAVANGIYRDYLYGKKYNTCSLRVLCFNFERVYEYESNNDKKMFEETKKLVIDYDEEYDNYYYPENDDDTDEDDIEYDSSIVSFGNNCVFGVIFTKFINNINEYSFVITAIHRKYRKAIELKMCLSDKNGAMHYDEIDYEDVDQVLKPILVSFNVLDE